MEQIRAKHLGRIRDTELGVEAECRLLSAVTPYKYVDLMELQSSSMAELRDELETQLENWGDLSPREEECILTLATPYTVEGREFVSISIRYPKVKDLAVSRIKGEYKKTRAIIGRLTGLSLVELDEMPVGDFQCISSWVVNQTLWGNEDNKDEDNE